MVIDAVKTAFQRAEEQQWDCTYWVIDLHGTILVPTRTAEISTQFYMHAKEVLFHLTHRTDINTILWTCSNENKVAKYVDYFAECGIVFDQIGHNHEVSNTEYGNYENKMYANVLLEDKAGFDPAVEWGMLRKYFGI
tara:strand:+ start:987 stop:1397 length:411 start_codon:yes stop_codon:yes gene_type:complete